MRPWGAVQIHAAMLRHTSISPTKHDAAPAQLLKCKRTAGDGTVPLLHAAWQSGQGVSSKRALHEQLHTCATADATAQPHMLLTWPAVSQICALIVLPSTCGQGAGGTQRWGCGRMPRCCRLQQPASAERGSCRKSITLACCHRCPPGCHEAHMQAHLDAARRKLHADGRLGLQRELVAREAAEQVGLADARVTNQHHLEQVVIAGGAAAGAAHGGREPAAAGIVAAAAAVGGWASCGGRLGPALPLDHATGATGTSWRREEGWGALERNRPRAGLGEGASLVVWACGRHGGAAWALPLRKRRGCGATAGPGARRLLRGGADRGTDRGSAARGRLGSLSRPVCPHAGPP